MTYRGEYGNPKDLQGHTTEFKAEALKLAVRVGVAEAVRQLKIYESQLYNLRTAIERKSNTSEREAELAAEVATLKRQLADQAEDLAILKKAAVPTLRRIKSKPIRIYARTTTAVPPQCDGVGAGGDTKWVFMPIYGSHRWRVEL